jgi:RNase H-like domain found in reverse transcriptase
LANTDNCKTSMVIPWIWKLLSKVYLPLLRPRSTLKYLTKKDKKFEWTMDCQNTFDIMKKQFTKEPVLLMPDQSKPFQIKSAASKVATGAVLTQLDSNRD